MREEPGVQQKHTHELELIDRVGEADGDPIKLSLAAVDFAVGRGEPWLRAALQASSIPHWFTAEILAQLMQIDEPMATQYFKAVIALPMVETFEAYHGWNVHETTRIALRSELAREKPQRFRELSARAAEAFEGNEPDEQVERAYHILSASPDEGRRELRRLRSLWRSEKRFEELETLESALIEQKTKRSQVTPRSVIIVVIGLLIGGVIGRTYPSFEFNRWFGWAITLVALAVLFGRLVCGVWSAARDKAALRIGKSALTYFLLATAWAVVIGFVATHLIDLGKSTALYKQPEDGFKPLLISLGFFATAVFFIIIALRSARMGDAGRPLVYFADKVARGASKILSWLMWLAPICIGVGFGSIWTNSCYWEKLEVLVLRSFLGQALFVLSLIVLMVIKKLPLASFFKAARWPVLLGFSTASSEAALPSAMHGMSSLGIPKRIWGVVLPAGISFNLDGSTVYLVIVSLFLSQLPSSQTTWQQKALLLLSVPVLGKLVAPVPRGSFAVISLLISFSLLPARSAEIMAAVLVIDFLLDMCRTSVNVLSNCVAAALVAKWEGVTLHMPHFTDSEGLMDVEPWEASA